MEANRERVRYLNDCATYSKKLAEMETANAEVGNRLFLPFVFILCKALCEAK